MTLPLNAPQATLELVGGKGANLARLALAGCPVPPGFFISVAGYQSAVRANGLEASIRAALDGARLDDPAGLEQVSAQIRALFPPSVLPPSLAREILARWQAWGSPAVAVRSSATAEDLPEMSFAGQQDTYLNVRGEEALLRAVTDCWASLWTARAIGYRQRQAVGQTDISLAVVVQQMVQSESSGVLFTANPLSGLRGETVIDATLGLGEGLVSGLVEPDHYVVDMRTGQISHKTLGAKALAVVSRAEGGVHSVETGAAARQALPDAQILALAEMGQRVEEGWGAPQDIEWAWDGARLYLLQTRAITSLYPAPEGLGPEELKVMFSFAAVQGMLDPMTPLGRDVIALILGGGARLFGRALDERTQNFLRTAGERLWVDITSAVRNPVGRKIASFALTFVEPGAQRHLLQIWDDPRLQPTTRHIRPATALRVARGLLPVAARVVVFLASPEKRMPVVQARTQAVLDDFRKRLAAVSGTREQKLGARLAILRNSGSLFERMAYTFLPGIASAMSMWTLMHKIAAQVDRAHGGGNRYDLLAVEATRGVPNNVTTEMDLILWQTARAIRSDAASARVFQSLPAAELAARWQAGSLPGVAQTALTQFLERYGMRGLAEIDFGRPRWLDDPTHVTEVLGSYLQIEDSAAPDVIFARGTQAGAAAVQALAQAARGLPGGWWKARLVRFAGRRVRALIGIREAPKFYAVSAMAINRTALLDSGREYAQAGLLARADDIFYLYIRELEALAAGEPRDWRALVQARRAAGEREKRRRQIPRLLLSDGRAFYTGMLPTATGLDGAGTLHGSPVSPGLVEGLVRVVLDPRGAQLAPGEILVCPGTDPSWTPLFLAAGGLVMEVGGMMTHGAVVAREYGIPAVAGVDRVTQRLQTGQRVRLDGSSGVVLLLEEAVQQE